MAICGKICEGHPERFLFLLFHSSRAVHHILPLCVAAHWVPNGHHWRTNGWLHEPGQGKPKQNNCTFLGSSSRIGLAFQWLVFYPAASRSQEDAVLNSPSGVFRRISQVA